MDQVWANRAASAEAAVAARHLKKLWGLPGTQLGVVAWPPSEKERRFATWHFWWQAHLLDCLVDAQVRDPQPARVESITRQIRGHRVRNNGSWTNDYYDDMAWLALALERAGRLVGIERQSALNTLSEQFVNAWVPEDGGGIPWRKSDQFFNAPANGPAGIFLARDGDRLRRAQQMADWIEATLVDPETHLVFDGIKAGSLVRAQYTYCQGAVVGLETELAVRTGEERHAERVHRLVAAISREMAPEAAVVPMLSTGATETAACSPGSPRATWRWRPPRCPGTRPSPRRRGRPPRMSCSNRPSRHGTTGRPSTASRCSGRSGTAPPTCPVTPVRRSRPPSPSTRCPSPSATCRCRSPAGC